MGHIVIKPHRDRDEYVYWSSIVEAPIAYGSRAEMRQILADDHARSGAPTDSPEVRLERTDRNGSSDLSHRDGWWDDPGQVYEQRGWLPREHLYRAAVLLDEGHDSQVWDLLVPFEDQMEVRRG